MKVSETEHNRLRAQFESMKKARSPWLEFWRELAEYILPRRYTSLHETPTAAKLRNSTILNGTATIAAYVLASGMMNGITSPARPWFRLRDKAIDEAPDVKEWLDDCVQRMIYVMSESNFYQIMATTFLDLSVFGTSMTMIYEDDEYVFRCYNYALGEYCFFQNEKGIVDRISCHFKWRVEQIVKRFGLENCSIQVQEAWNKGGAQWNNEHEICWLLEPASKELPNFRPIHKFRQTFWEKAGAAETVLEVAGFREWPAICPRWAVIGNDSYGVGPSADALGDVKQLQHESKRKAQALDFMVRPPLVADQQLQHRPTALLPGGITYVSGLANNEGVRPIYTVNAPIAELANDILAVEERIRRFFYNDLFQMISQLDTVRSAREIDARVEEKLILLGPVLERFSVEALDVALGRIFAIMLRKNLFLPVPESLQGRSINIQYISVLNDAQRAVGAAPIERYVSFIGNVGAVRQDVLEIPDWINLTLDYAERLGIPQKDNHTIEEIQQMMADKNRQAQAAQMAELTPKVAQGAKLLSETPVGGGASALQAVLGG